MFDCDLIAYQYYKGQFTPQEVYVSGEREETTLIDKYSKAKGLAVLVLEDDIVNSKGYGLKKGFYNVIADKYLDYLLIYQSGELKAKVPILERNVQTTQELVKTPKPKKMSARKYQRYQEKQYRKYMYGQNPDEVEYKNVQIEYIKESDAWLIIYSHNNMELIGIIKL